jgi:hypothetical protein
MKTFPLSFATHSFGQCFKLRAARKHYNTCAVPTEGKALKLLRLSAVRNARG